jgi:hypothetical protein
MIKYLKMLFGNSGKKELCDLPKSTIQVPMPIVKPLKNEVEELAYYLAETDGFKSDALSYWNEAEKRVNASKR